MRWLAMRQLQSREARHRVAGAKALAGDSSESAVTALTLALSDPEFSVRNAAGNSLASLPGNWYEHPGARAAVPKLIERLDAEGASSAAARVCQRAIQALGELRDSRAIRPLLILRVMGSGEWDREIHFALEKIDAQWASSESARTCEPELLAATHLENPETRRRAGELLVRLTGTTASPTIARLLEETRESEYAYELIRLGDPRGVEHLLSELEAGLIEMTSDLQVALQEFLRSHAATLQEADLWRLHAVPDGETTVTVWPDADPLDPDPYEFSESPWRRVVSHSGGTGEECRVTIDCSLIRQQALDELCRRLSGGRELTDEELILPEDE